MPSYHHRLTVFACIIAVALTTSACGTVSIRQVLADPEVHVDQDVTVRGHVTEAASLLGKGAYQLSDGGQSIWHCHVVRHAAQGSSRGCDGSGPRGIRSRRHITSCPNVLGDGVVLVESSHRVRD